MALNNNMSLSRAAALVYAHCPDGYAKAYAAVILNTDSKEIQHDNVLYLLNNMRSWRGPMATSVRSALRNYISN